MARNWGVSVTAAEVEGVRDAADVIDLVAAALGRPPGRLGRAPRSPKRADQSHAHPPPSTLPAFDVLRDEGVMVMGRMRRTGRTSAPCASGFST
jgi:hypothetical protein